MSKRKQQTLFGFKKKTQLSEDNDSNNSHTPNAKVQGSCTDIKDKSPILKFDIKNNISVTFEIPPTYPQTPPCISLSSVELTNTERSVLENEIRKLATESLGNPMIMDLVIKLQQLVIDCKMCNVVIKKQNSSDNDYIAMVLIDHMRQKRKYTDALTSWASELNINGCLLFCQRWIFLLLQGPKKYVKEFIVRHKTVCIDVDSSGKPCKEKMSKILYEGESSKNFSTFSIKDMTLVEEMEVYFTELNLGTIYKEVIKPIYCKSK